MLDSTRAKISQLKDLKAVFFYCLDKDLKKINNTDLLGLKIVYGEDNNLNLDYSSPHFKEFVLKVLEVYNEEKDTNNIILLNDLTEKLLANAEIEKMVETDNKNKAFYQSRPILELTNRNNDLAVAKDYVRDIIKNLKPLFFEEEKIDFGEIKGYQNRYFLTYETDLGEGLIPFILYKSAKDFYFKISGIKKTSVTIEGKISIDSGSVSISWNIDKTNFLGQEIFKFNGLHERSIFNDGEIVNFDNNTCEITPIEKERINTYFEVLGIDRMEKGIKTGDNRFILGQSISDNKDDNGNVLLEKTAHVFLKEDFVNITYVNKYGLVKNDNSFVLTIFEEKEDITVIPFTDEEDNYLVVQHHYMPSGKMRGEYKEKVNKYAYQIFKINKIDSLLDLEGVLEEKQLNSSVNSIQAIKKYIKRGDLV